MEVEEIPFALLVGIALLVAMMSFLIYISIRSDVPWARAFVSFLKCLTWVEHCA